MRRDCNTTRVNTFLTCDGSKDIIEVNHGHQVTLSENHEHHQFITLTDQMNAAITWLRRDGAH